MAEDPIISLLLSFPEVPFLLSFSESITSFTWKSRFLITVTEGSFIRCKYFTATFFSFVNDDILERKKAEHRELLEEKQRLPNNKRKLLEFRKSPRTLYYSIISKILFTKPSRRSFSFVSIFLPPERQA